MSRWVICFSLVVGWVASAVAQTSGGMAGETVSLGALIQQGGWAMYPLGLFSLAMLYFIIRNSLMLRERAMLRPDLKDEIEAFMRRRDVAGLRALCAEHDSLMTTVLDAGMQRVEEAELRAALDG